MEKETKNACPVCGTETTQNGVIVYCGGCGFSIRGDESGPDCNAVSDGENMNFKNVNI